MGKLRDNKDKKELVRDKAKSLFSELLDCDEDYALNLIEWYLEKTNTNKKHLQEMGIRNKMKPLRDKKDNESKEKYSKLRRELQSVLPNNYPKDIKKGDVLHVTFGQGYATELSDGHYAVILARKGSHFLVAPITKTQQPDKDNTMKLENIGLPGQDKGFINYGQLRFVNYRRVENIYGISNRINIIDKVDEILEKFNNIVRKA